MASLIQQADHVLSILRKHQSVLDYGDIKKKTDSSLIVIEPSVLMMLIEKLHRDNYIYVDPTSQRTYYNITLEGNLFEGYEKQAKSLLTKRRLARFQGWTLAIGTGLAGLYGLFEIVKWALHYFWCIPI